jgi:catechol 2,3-dioxygenase-like lactoylglutathione lyase family enzyme
MIRVRDNEKSLSWYKDVLGMRLLKTIDGSDFTIYFLGYLEPDFNPEDPKIAYREGLLELTWNHGTEKDDNFKYHSGNDEPKGFGHIGEFPGSINGELPHKHEVVLIETCRDSHNGGQPGRCLQALRRPRLLVQEEVDRRQHEEHCLLARPGWLLG